MQYMGLIVVLQRESQGNNLTFNKPFSPFSRTPICYSKVPLLSRGKKEKHY